MQTAKKIKLVCFDLWDTIIRDDSDEPKRKEKGLLPKKEARVSFIYETLFQEFPKLEKNALEKAFQNTTEEFNRIWHEEQETWSVEKRLHFLFQTLGVQPSPSAFQKMQKELETMEIQVFPDLLPGIAEVLPKLKKHYSLAIISDAIYTPGRYLRKILEHHDLLKYFDHFVFSDEAGKSKPATEVFQEAARPFTLQPKEVAHLGDRENKDITGANQFGAYSILCTVAVHRSPTTEAHAICDSFDQLPEILVRICK